MPPKPKHHWRKNRSIMYDPSPKDLFGLGRARAAAKDIKCNPKNLEYHWYGFWDRVAHQITTSIDIGPFTVCPQFPLWRLRDEPVDDIDAIKVSTDPDGDIEMEEDEDDWDHETEANASFGTDDFENLGKTRIKITDFALVHWLENNSVNQHKDDENDEEWRIERELIPALIEIKRAVPRDLKGGKLNYANIRQMVVAKEAVFKQAMYLFANPRWRDQESVLVIAAVGDIFSSTVVSKLSPKVKEALAEVDSRDVDYEPGLYAFEAEAWSEACVWGKEVVPSQMEVVTQWIEQYLDEHARALS